MHRTIDRRVGVGEAPDGAEGSAVAATSCALDRDRLAALVQQTPSEGYRFRLTRRDAETGADRWRDAVIGDVDGHDVLRLVEGGRAALVLRDLGAALDRLGLDLGSTPRSAPLGHRLRRGLILVSARVHADIGTAAGEGGLHVLAGTATLMPAANEIVDLHHDQLVAVAPGASLPWHRGTTTIIATGAETLLALTWEFVPERAFPRLGDVARRFLAAVRGRSAAPATDDRSRTLRLVRARPGVRGVK